MDVKLKNDNEKIQLIADCLSQKRKAQYQLFKTYHNMMLNVCMRYADDSDEAKDILNEGFIKIFSNLEKYKQTGSLENWMKRVMTNTALDFHRRYKKMDTVSYEAVTDSEIRSVSENTAISKLSYEELLHCIRRLPPVSRNVFNLYVFEEYNHKEIADMLGIKEGTSHWHLNFARKRLKELIMMIPDSSKKK